MLAVLPLTSISPFAAIHQITTTKLVADSHLSRTLIRLTEAIHQMTRVHLVLPSHLCHISASICLDAVSHPKSSQAYFKDYHHAKEQVL